LSHFAGFALSVRVLWEYGCNSALHYPSTILQSFVALLVPAAAYSSVSFFYFTSSLLRGSQTTDARCEAVAFVIYAAVIAALCASPLVAAVSYINMKRLNSQNALAPELPRLPLWAFVTTPWLVGVLVAIVVQLDGKLGSYRALYCCATTSGRFVTGGLTMLIYILTTTLAVTFYWLCRRGFRAVSASGADMQGLRPAEALGAKLVCFNCLAWLLWASAGFSWWLGSKPSIPLDMAAALIASLQPSVSALIVLNAPVVKARMHHRLLLQVHGYAELTQRSFASSASQRSSQPGEAGAPALQMVPVEDPNHLDDAEGGGQQAQMQPQGAARRSRHHDKREEATEEALANLLPSAEGAVPRPALVRRPWSMPTTTTAVLKRHAVRSDIKEAEDSASLLIATPNEEGGADH